MRTICDDFEVSRYIVRRVVDEAGVRRRLTPASPDEEALVVSCMAQGLSLKAVGERVGRDAATVRNILVRRAVARRDVNGR